MVIGIPKWLNEYQIYGNIKLSEEQTTCFASSIAGDIQLFVKEHQHEFEQYLNKLNQKRESIISISTKYLTKLFNGCPSVEVSA